VQCGQLTSREKYFLAAADQPSGPRASRLAQVIKAKYDAGLLKPYDYIKGYERMNKWMDSGRAAPKADSIQGSAPSSPQIRASGRARLVGMSIISLDISCDNGRQRTNRKYSDWFCTDCSACPGFYVRCEHFARIAQTDIDRLERIQTKVPANREDVDGCGFGVCGRSDGALDARVR
jgi:hypothetical protein